MIYHNFIIEVDHDLDDHDILLGMWWKKGSGFLNNEIVWFSIKKNGPIERMYSKIAEHSTVDRDTIAQFEKEDFLVSRFIWEHSACWWWSKSGKIGELLSDEKGATTA